MKVINNCWGNYGYNQVAATLGRLCWRNRRLCSSGQQYEASMKRCYAAMIQMSCDWKRSRCNALRARLFSYIDAKPLKVVKFHAAALWAVGIRPMVEQYS